MVMCFEGLRYARQRVLPLFIACALVAFVCLQTAAAQTASPAGAGQLASGNIIAAYAYVGTNVSGNGNGNVSDYVISATGISLSPVGHQVSGASGSLAVNQQFVFATDGTNVVTYGRGANGDLHEVASVNGVAHNITPQDSLVGSIVLDRGGQTLYADEINYDGADDDAYTIWTINSNGSLVYAGATDISSDYFAPLAFSQNDLYAYGYGCYFASWDIFGFTRNTQNGALTSSNPNAAIPPGNGMYCPANLAVSAMNYVAVAYSDVSQQGSNFLLADYAINNNNGTLNLVQNSEITTPFTAVTSTQFDPTGTYLAVAGNLGIQMYQLTSAGTLTAIGSVVDPNVAFETVRWDNSNHLYAISSSGLYVFRSTNGVLTQAPGYPLPQNQAASLAVLPAQ